MSNASKRYAGLYIDWERVERELSRSKSAGESCVIYETDGRKAIKAKLRKHDVEGSLEQEYDCYNMALQGIKGIPIAHSYGECGHYNILKLDLLGSSLYQILSSIENDLDLNTVCALGHQMLERIESVHKKGLIHRNITPSHFVFGRPGTKDEELLHLIDFSQAKLFNLDDPPPSRTDISRCLSKLILRSHEQCSLSRKDDIERIGRILVYLASSGRIPWNDHSSAAVMSLDDLPPHFNEFMRYTNTLEPLEEPDYSYLHWLLSDLSSEQLQPESTSYPTAQRAQQEVEWIDPLGARALSPTFSDISDISSSLIHSPLQENDWVDVQPPEILAMKNCDKFLPSLPDDLTSESDITDTTISSLRWSENRGESRNSIPILSRLRRLE